MKTAAVRSHSPLHAQSSCHYRIMQAHSNFRIAAPTTFLTLLQSLHMTVETPEPDSTRGS
jgi:hypothetical protein